MNSDSLHHTSPEIQALLEADSSKIDALYRDYYPRIESLILKMNGNREVAKDVFQEGLIVIYQKAKDPDFSLHCSFYTFLYAVCRNLFRDELKKKRNTEVTLNDETLSISEDVIDEQIQERQRIQFYQQKFQLLQKDCQKLLQMYFSGSSMREIAKAMDTTEGYIRKKKHGCKEKLKKLMIADPLYLEFKLNDT